MSRSPSAAGPRRTGPPRRRPRAPSGSPPGSTRPANRRQPRKGSAGKAWLKVLGASLACGVLCISGLIVWSLGPASTKKEGAGPVFVYLADKNRAHVVTQLEEAGLVQSPRLMWLYLTVLLPTVVSEPGEHLLRHGLSPRELSARLARLPRRSTAGVAVPEGWHRKKIARRLEEAEVCGASAFLAATEQPELLDQLGIEGPSAEGYLFPATYELSHNTPPEAVVARMVRETRKRLETLQAAHPGAFERLHEAYGWGEREVLTLASIIEKETAHGSERPLIASVFLNRLTRPEGETLGRLQSDPTAAYGCEYEPERATSCGKFDGRVQPALLRDPDNRYNTYRRPGLPPGPIANPGLLAVEAVLAPRESDYLFFVADGAGNHAFSRTFEEHQGHVARLRALRGRTAAQPSDVE